MAPSTKRIQFRTAARLEQTRTAIQYEFIRLLEEADFDFSIEDEDEKRRSEPFGIQKKVMEAVNKKRFSRGTLHCNAQMVSQWSARCRRNQYMITEVRRDYSKSSQNRRKFHNDSIHRIRERVQQEELKCNEIQAVWSDEANQGAGGRITISQSSVRRCITKPFMNQPRLIAAVPKPLKVEGFTAHHNKARYVQAQYWNKCTQQQIEGIWFGDETKISFCQTPNKAINIKWVPRGSATKENWYSRPRHPGQVNVFIVMSIEGIELYDMYDRNMTLSHYKGLLPQIKKEVTKSDAPFFCFLHDNHWSSAQPKKELTECFGSEGFTKYMGAPCWKPSKTEFTPVRKLPARQYKLRCSCKFPTGPIHASYNPKMNCVEELFAELDQIMLKNSRDDAKQNQPWPTGGPNKASTMLTHFAA